MKIKVTKRQFKLLLDNLHLLNNKGLKFSGIDFKNLANQLKR
jgi:hypothetical protein